MPGLRRVLGDGELGRVELDAQGHQVLLRPVVDVALQPPPRFVLRGDQPLPGGPQVLDQARVGRHQACLRGDIGYQLLPGRAQRLVFGHLDRDRVQQRRLVHHRHAHLGARQGGQRLPGDGQAVDGLRARVHAARRGLRAARRAGTRCRSADVSARLPAISATDAAATQPASHRAVRTLIPTPRHRPCPASPSMKDPPTHDPAHQGQ